MKSAGHLLLLEPIHVSLLRVQGKALGMGVWETLGIPVAFRDVILGSWSLH